jgi:hypothetical protein
MCCKPCVEDHEMNETIPQVLHEIQSGDGLAMSAAGRLFPGHRDKSHVDPSTVFRWMTKGSKTVDGSATVKLEAVRVGGRWLTSRGAVARFVQALTDAATPILTSSERPRSEAASRRNAEQAAKELERLGA